MNSYIEPYKYLKIELETDLTDSERRIAELDYLRELLK
jgi:hypothetical protein